MQPQPGPPWTSMPPMPYSMVGELRGPAKNAFLDQVTRTDPLRAAELSVLYAIRDRTESVFNAVAILGAVLALILVWARLTV